MKKRLRLHYKEAELDSSSVADLAFLLLIFFIVTSSFILRQGLFLSLPSPNAAPVRVAPDKIIKVEPLPQGYRVGGEILEEPELKTYLLERTKPDTVCVILMRKNLPYERLTDTLSVLKEAGVKKSSLREVD